MRLRPQFALALLLMATFGHAVDAAPKAPNGTDSPPATIAWTRQNAFTIPFRIEPAEGSTEQPIEVQLHVSANQGANWELSSHVKPEKGSFVFRAPHDGEYWYCIRTVDKRGQVRPEGAFQPQLKVVVDTVAPRLDLTASRGEAGEIVARWQAVDPNLKLGSFKLEYRADPTAPWESVAVESPPTAMRHTLSGEATWWPKASNSGSIAVRATIADNASNPAVSQASVTLTGPKLNEAVASDQAKTNTGGASPAASGATDSTRWPPDRSTPDPLARSANPDSGPSNSSTARDTDWREAGSTEKKRPANGGVPAQPVGQNSANVRPGALDFSLLPPGERPRMVNSRSFELEYEIDSVGPSGIAKVELWGTRDGGRTWSSIGTDADNRSPMSISVPGEGIYGFRIVVQSGSGLGGRPPLPGDMPEIWIGVDLTKPVGRITAAEVAADTSELVIRWEASDERPDPRPITITFGSAVGGPWMPVASGLENTGSYRWRLDNRVPVQIYLRLEVRDEAGNVGLFELPEPVSLDRSRPEGHIRGVRPLGQVDRGKKVR